VRNICTIEMGDDRKGESHFS